MSLKLNTNEFEVPIINKYPTLNLALIVLLFLIILIFVNSKLAEDIEKNRKIYEHKNLKQALEKENQLMQKLFPNKEIANG